MKTEPSVFSFDDLIQAPKQTTCWEGVRNYQARNLMRDQIKKGDQVLIYHSNIEDPIVAGIAEVVREGYPDTTALDPKSHYYDPAAKAKNESPWVMVDVRAVKRFEAPVTRTQLKTEPALKNMMVLRRGARLSVQPVSEKEFQRIAVLGKPKPVRG